MSIKTLLEPQAKDWLALNVKSLSANTITEGTAGSGVLIDGTKIKDFEIIPRFGTSPTSRVTTDTNGDLDMIFRNTKSFRVYEDDGAGGTTLRFQQLDGATSNGTIRCAGAYAFNATATPRAALVDSAGLFGNTTSLLESKCNIGALDDYEGLYKLAPIKFNFRKKEKDGSYSKTKFEPFKNSGFIAEEVVKHLPLCADYNEDGSLHGIHYRFVWPYAVKCIQEQKKKIDQLEKRIKALEEK